MKKKIILILGIVISTALCFSGCDTGLLDDGDNSSTSEGSGSGATDGYRLTKTVETINGNVYVSVYEYLSGLKIDTVTQTLNDSDYVTKSYSYNSAETISEIKYIYTDATFSFKYSDYNDNELFERSESYTDGVLGSYSIYTYEYDSSELTSSTQKTYDTDNTLLFSAESTYEDGRIVENIRSDNIIENWSYDSHGCIKIYEYTYDVETYTTTYTNEYSSTGNLIKQTLSSGDVFEYEYETY